MLKTVLRSNSIVTVFLSESENRKNQSTQEADYHKIKDVGRLQLLKFNDNVFLKQGNLFDIGNLSEISEEFTISELKNISNFIDFDDTDLNTLELRGLEQLNRKGKKYNGFLSYKSQRDIRRIIDTWIESYLCYSDFLAAKKKKKLHLPTFVTLTYPTSQKHSDNYCKREHLNNFIMTCKRKHNTKKYIWKAELQRNGNLHFHLLLDSYIEHKVLRSQWNNILEGDYYISNFEKKHNHRNPNSTDIKGLSKVKNISAYISKYCSKVESDKLGVRQLEGRVWGCSDNVRNIKQPNLLGLLENNQSFLDNTYLINELIDFVRNSSAVKFEVDPNQYSTYLELKQPIRKILPVFNFGLNNLYQEHYRQVFNQIS